MSLLGEARDLALDHGLWLPEGDPGRLRHLAHAWEAAATACDFAADDVAHAVRGVRLDNESRAIDAFTDHADLIVLELGDEADRCRQVAGTLHGRANDIEQARRRIEALAVEVSTALAAGALLTLFTGGVSDLMAAELTATAVADAAAIGLTMSETAIALAARIAAYATLGAWEAGVIDITTQTAGNVVQNRDPFEGFSEQRFMIDVGTGGVLGGLVSGLTFVAPLPPPPRTFVFDAFDDLLLLSEPLPTLTPTEERMFLEESWHPSTFGSAEESWTYHLDKHGEGRSLFEYTTDARRFFLEHKDRAVPVTLNDGTEGLRIRFRVKIEGVKKPLRVGGYWTTDGRIASSFDKGH